MGFEAAMDALAADAKAWDGIADTLRSAATEADGLTLSDDEFSFIGSATGLTSTYSAIRARVSALLQGGETETRAIGTELLNVKKTYEGTDAAAKARLDGVWEVAE